MDDGELLISSRVLAPLATSKSELRLQLNHPWSYIAAEAVAENAGRWLFQVADLAETWIGAVVIGPTKIRMIEEVEELETDPQHSIFPARDLGVFHDAEIGIEIARIAEAVASLSKGNDRPTETRT